MDTTALGRPSRSFSACSFLLSVLFAYSAVVQLNDEDWYIWLPFYSLACLVCLAHVVQFSTVSRLSASVGLVSGLVLFIKVVLEGCLRGGLVFSWTDFVSIDMDQRLVREKLGSLIVCVALWIELGMSGGAPNEGGWRLASLHTGLIYTSIAFIFLLSFSEESRKSLRYQQSFKMDRHCMKSASSAVIKKWKDIASRV